VKLSYVLPCYNVEHYIAQCLQSIYNQDIPESEYEVICVDDCSSDSTRRIVLEWQSRHPNLVLLCHTENKKQGGARNTGLRTACGEYVWFIDSDDYIKDHCAGKLLEILEQNDLDFIAFESDTVDKDANLIGTSRQNFTSEICSGMKFFDIDIDDRWEIVFHVWKRIIKRRFLEQNGLSFYEHFHNEDIAFGIHSFLLAQKVKYLPESIVCYRQHQNSDMALRGVTQQGANAASYFKLTCELANMLPGLTDNRQKAVVLEYINYYQKIYTKHFWVVVALSPAQRQIFYSKLKDIPDWHQTDIFMSETTKFVLNHPCCMAVLHPIMIIPRKIRLFWIKKLHEKHRFLKKIKKK